ncbi:hypothetical protein AtNW77_Chr2g0243431 [Arabidopsis thaliana]|uniref:Uncharacterized protein n=1 Tax=Arabidopsis thaliana TaxID=3702 RepID=A0A1P8AZR6_ARATH|nr:uncharacterized protein AT2G24535 [Arabidopsis thaliana]ANM62145.1 hypothetical protein AT2G24535 [Arabidopsis thaliana]|eukprot:NP_001324323.1 hypothetical protein AT2G24535 [Arabidopsis thaliana]
MKQAVFLNSNRKIGEKAEQKQISILLMSRKKMSQKSRACYMCLQCTLITLLE